MFHGSSAQGHCKNMPFGISSEEPHCRLAPGNKGGRPSGARFVRKTANGDAAPRQARRAAGHARPVHMRAQQVISAASCRDESSRLPTAMRGKRCQAPCAAEARRTTEDPASLARVVGSPPRHDEYGEPERALAASASGCSACPSGKFASSSGDLSGECEIQLW